MRAVRRIGSVVLLTLIGLMAGTLAMNCIAGSHVIESEGAVAAGLGPTIGPMRISRTAAFRSGRTAGRYWLVLLSAGTSPRCSPPLANGRLRGGHCLPNGLDAPLRI